jgi:two-component system, NarL family, nitrate/nitrite response regulator NarL
MHSAPARQVCIHLELLAWDCRSVKVALGGYKVETQIMRILVADDHPLYREAVARQVVRLFPEASVEEAQSLHEAVAVARAEGHRPALFIVDYYMPGMSADAISELVAEFSGVPILILSGWASPSSVQSMIRSGARGFLPKTATSEQFAHAIQLLLAGGTSVPAELLLGGNGEPSQASVLTPRETDVLRAAARGLSNKEIARELEVAEVTIKLHLTTIYRKIGARSRTEAAMIASKSGLV